MNEILIEAAEKSRAFNEAFDLGKSEPRDLSVEEITLIAKNLLAAEQRGYEKGFAAGKRSTWLEVKKDLDEMNELIKSRMP